ncbi:hypothetical protein PybrP1_002166 [[Pythium] brassicae (nom. inval.)]|nr:hypothetical protein PybrP1_002166 [[Pythium] brassicae (nom. inval.)]
MADENEQKAPAAAATSALHSHQHAEKPHVSWDEETIAEHDLLRGTRQKIDEPNTPYHYYAAEAAGEGELASPARSLSGREDAPSLEWGELHSKLQSVKQRASDWDSNSDDEGGAHFAERDAEGKKIAKDPKFASKRKMHYNEFERVKAWRQSHPDDEDEDEGESESKKSAE